MRGMDCSMLRCCGKTAAAAGRTEMEFYRLPRLFYKLYPAMECIVVIYIASWITAGLSFCAMYVYKQRSLLR